MTEPEVEGLRSDLGRDPDLLWKSQQIRNLDFYRQQNGTRSAEPARPADPVQDAALFEVEAPPPVSLADKFGIPPFSVLDRRAGDWTNRKRQWLSLGIKSEVGREQGLAFLDHSKQQNAFAKLLSSKLDKRDPVTGEVVEASGGTSVFDPVLCELAYRWFSAESDVILDPFAGGSVRGIAASILGRHYVGVDLRPEQIAANEAQRHLGRSDYPPIWYTGDSARLDDVLDAKDAEFDLVFSCPPYADLEVYSDDPADLSNMPYPEFLTLYRRIIFAACRRLRTDRFAGWVVSDVRDPKGAYRGLVGATVQAFLDAGLTLHNDAVLVDPVGTAPVRAERPFRASRKLCRTHQHLLIFAKGDPGAAARRIEAGGTPAAAPAEPPQPAQPLEDDEVPW